MDEATVLWEVLVAIIDQQHPRGANFYHNKLSKILNNFWKMLKIVVSIFKFVINRENCLVTGLLTFLGNLSK